MPSSCYKTVINFNKLNINVLNTGAVKSYLKNNFGTCDSASSSNLMPIKDKDYHRLENDAMNIPINSKQQVVYLKYDNNRLFSFVTGGCADTLSNEAINPTKAVNNNNNVSERAKIALI